MFTVAVEIPHSTILLLHRLSLRFVSTFARSFICVNSNYVERLSAVSAQTRILLPLEDEINARPINSTLPSSSPPLVPWPRHSPCCRFIPLPFHLRWMILLDYTITADRLCLTFGRQENEIPDCWRRWIYVTSATISLCRVRLTVNPLIITSVVPFVNQTIRTFSACWPRSQIFIQQQRSPRPSPKMR